MFADSTLAYVCLGQSRRSHNVSEEASRRPVSYSLNHGIFRRSSRLCSLPQEGAGDGQGVDAEPHKDQP